jgi:hypothetical protein
MSSKDETKVNSKTTEVKDWNEQLVSQWLQEHGLAKFIGRFEQQYGVR